VSAAIKSESERAHRNAPGIGDGSLLSIEAICREFFWPTLTASRQWLEIKTKAYIFVRNCRQPYGSQNLEAK